MRRKDRQVNDPAQITEIMARGEVLRLALNGDVVPYILPVNYGMEPDGMTLYIHGAMTGTKYSLMERDNRASFEIDRTNGLVLDEADHECSILYESVVGWGYLEELTEDADKRHALKRIMAQYHAEDFPFSEKPMPHTRILCLRVQERTAKRRMKG